MHVMGEDGPGEGGLGFAALALLQRPTSSSWLCCFQNDLINLPFGARVVHSEVSRCATNCENRDTKVQPKVIKVVRAEKRSRKKAFRTHPPSIPYFICYRHMYNRLNR